MILSIADVVLLLALDDVPKIRVIVDVVTRICGLSLSSLKRLALGENFLLFGRAHFGGQGLVVSDEAELGEMISRSAFFAFN